MFWMPGFEVKKLGVSVSNFGKHCFFATTFFWEVTSLRVQFQSCQLNLCEQNWISFVIDKTCHRRCGIFQIDFPDREVRCC